MADGRTTATPDPALLDQINDETAKAQATTRANDPEDGGRGINPRTVEAKLRSTQAATTAAIGAGFEFTPEEVAAQLKHCQQQLSELNIDFQIAQRTVGLVQGPAPDNASQMQAAAVQAMMANTAEVIRADIAYLTNWQNKLNAAKQNYMANEHLNEQEWAKLSQGLQA
jgi:hypothetical protein